MFVICRPNRLYIFFDCSLKKTWKPGLGSRSDTEHRLRSPTPTPTRSPSSW